MIASWMLYAFAIGALVTIAAFGLERVAQATGRPARFIWAGAVASSVAWPVLHLVGRFGLTPAKSPGVLPFVIVVQAPAAIVDAAATDPGMLIERGLAALWLLSSLALLARLVVGIRVLGRSRSTWRAGSVDGVGVRLSDNIGPAVVGLRSMDLVLPEWTLVLDAPLRALVLRHEQEHRAARDPLLLFGAAVAVVLMPWNLPLWIAARRLRLAVEMDCDARVLRAFPSPERYGMLMLTIAQRRSRAPAMFTPMLSEPTSDLERRILAMRTPTKKLARFTALGGGVIAVGTLAFACTLQSAPDDPRRVDAQPPEPASAAAAPARYHEFRIEKAATPMPGNRGPRYPDALRAAGIEGSVLAEFVVDTTGYALLESFKVLKSTDTLFTATVRNALGEMRFYPAEVNGRKVRQMLEMPFVFDLSR